MRRQRWCRSSSALGFGQGGGLVGNAAELARPAFGGLVARTTADAAAIWARKVSGAQGEPGVGVAGGENLGHLAKAVAGSRNGWSYRREVAGGAVAGSGMETRRRLPRQFLGRKAWHADQRTGRRRRLVDRFQSDRE
jgi:hypothetical protein